MTLLGRALAATDVPPVVAVLNSCESLAGCEPLLTVVPVVIGVSAKVSDLAANLFASQFYAAIANAQSVGAAIRQAGVRVDLAGLGEGWKLASRTIPDIDLDELVLVKVLEER